MLENIKCTENRNSEKWNSECRSAEAQNSGPVFLKNKKLLRQHSCFDFKFISVEHLFLTYIDLKITAIFRLVILKNTCEHLFFEFLKKIADNYPADTYLITVNEGNIRTMREICPKLTIRTPERRNDVVLVSLLLTLKIFHPLLGCLYC